MSISNQGSLNRPVKATLCRYFASDGQCFYGDSCQFVHAKPSSASTQPGKGFTVLPSSSGFNADGAANQYTANNHGIMENENFSNNFSGLSISGKEQPEPVSNALTPGVISSNVNTTARQGNQAFEFLPTATNHAHQVESIGGTTYFYPEGQASEQQPSIILPSYHAYPNTPSHLAHLQAIGKQPGNPFSLSPQIRQDLINQHTATLVQLDPETSSIPQEVENYHTLFPLEHIDSIANQQSRRTFGCISSCYKAVNSKDGLTYVLRRIHGSRVTNSKAMAIVEQWKNTKHSNLVQLREVFTSKAFDDNSLVFVYDYHPAAETVLQKHFFDTASGMKDASNGAVLKPGRKGFSTPNASQPRQQLVPERMIWNYVIQLSSALRTIHSAGLACRVIDSSKILILSNSRLRVNGCGIFDVLDSNNNATLTQRYQQQDLLALGKLILSLACYSLQACTHENIQQSVEFVNMKYSNDLQHLIAYLLSQLPPSHVKSINDIMPMIGARFYTQLDTTQLRCDILQNEIAKEMENSRLFRLLCKIGCINDRPEFNMDPSWSETGDRYLIKLFRDHLFHQVTENGEPWIDMSHIVSSLNKLDSGSPEKVCLMSRDEQTVLVVSYRDLKACFVGAYTELLGSMS